MTAKASLLGLLGGAGMLLLSVFFAAFPMLYDMTPMDPVVQAVQDIETAVFAYGGFIIVGLGFTGSLMIRRNKRLSRILLICSAALCFAFALYFGLIVWGILFICIVSIPGVLISAACILSFLRGNSANNNSRYI